jgi:hypothetical protein
LGINAILEISTCIKTMHKGQDNEVPLLEFSESLVSHQIRLCWILPFSVCLA